MISRARFLAGEVPAGRVLLPNAQPAEQENKGVVKMNNICKKCKKLKNNTCKGMEEFYSGCIYFKKDITDDKKINFKVKK